MNSIKEMILEIIGIFFLIWFGVILMSFTLDHMTDIRNYFYPPMVTNIELMLLEEGVDL